MKLFDILLLICKFIYVVCFKGNVGILYEMSVVSKVIFFVFYFICSILSI